MKLKIPSRRRENSKESKAFWQRAEFKGIRKLSFRKYRNNIRQWYDGPAGAVLALSSAISLHEPLVGRMLRSKKFDVAEFQSVLDIGSGAGQILGHLLKQTCPEARLVACDLSHQMLLRARTRINDDRPDYIAADMTKLPFRENSFDCLTCGWVIEHLPDPTPGLSEFHRVLRPGGSILLLATEDSIPGILTSHTWKCRTYNRDELRIACEETGLPWEEQLWFTRIHRFFKFGGILFKATKQIPETEETCEDQLVLEEAQSV